MITDAIVDWFFGLVRDVLLLLPDFTVPVYLDELAGPLGMVMGVGGSLGAWVPTQFALTVFSSVLGAWGVAFAIKAIRIVASFFSSGGGSAA